MITFPQIEAWNANREVVTFPAEKDGKKIQCAISWEALQDNYGCNDAPPLDCFRTNRAAIENKAGSLINRKRFEADGSIMIRSIDGT